MRHVLSLAIALTLGTPAAAWGNRGHRAIADIAWTQLTPAARQEVAQLLAAAPALATPACPVGSFEDGATWADCVRSKYRDRFAATSTWHYVNVSICRPFQLPDDPDALFVVARFNRELAILANRHQPRVVRLEALLWVAHLAGDLHQPLHVGDAGDRGGNEVETSQQSGRYPVTLHAEWDRVLVDDAVDAEPGGVAGLAAAASDPIARQRWRLRSPAAWARESWEIAQRVAYGGQSDRCRDTAASVDVSGRYEHSAVPVVEEQLEKAGVRLADVLNVSLGKSGA